MTDCFALLGQSRRPWLDSDALKEHFHRLTAQHHPDVSPDSHMDFSSINAAYQLLRDPKARLVHLLELEFPGNVPDARNVPNELLDLFMQIAGALSSFAKTIKKLEAANAPLARALLASEQIATRDQLQGLSEILAREERSLLEQLQQLDALWPTQRQALLEPLSRIGQKFSFLLKWSDQVREAILRLS